MQTSEELISQMRQWREYEEVLRSIAESVRENPRPVYPPPPPGGLTGFEWWITVRCEDCDCAEIEATIAGQLAVLRALNAYTNFSLPLPSVTLLGNAAGLRGQGYRNASNCIQRAIDEMESIGNTVPYLFAFIGAAFSGTAGIKRQWRSNEIQRSRQFIEFLKAIYWLCCGEEEYGGLLERLASGQLQGNAPDPSGDPSDEVPY